MAFEELTEKISAAFRRLSSKGKLVEQDVCLAMREVRLALLEADVNYIVAKNFTEKVINLAIGSKILKSLTPAQMVIKIVHEQLVQLLGGGISQLALTPKTLGVLMFCGLQGSGKTTQCVKLAVFLKKKGFSPVLGACDVYRPAAVKQLEILATKAGFEVFTQPGENPVKISENALRHAVNRNFDVLILDTAGRLHIDEVLMKELEEIKGKVKPAEILLVLDAMTGQDAVNIAKTFNERLELSGVLLTKTDGDARGGAALSVREVTGKPIKFIGTGEHIGDLEPFYPERIASRILGMGDILSIIEDAQTNFDKENAEKIAAKMRENKFDFNDFLAVFSQIKRLGPIKKIIEKLPGVPNLQNFNVDDKMIGRIEAMVLSMTPEERSNPGVIGLSRRRRIARGSGNKIEEVNAFFRRFEEMRKMMKQFNGKKGGLFSRFLRY